MTKINLRMVTTLSGTMGDTTFRTLSPGNIVMSDKAKLPSFEDEEEKEARDIRADQFGGVNALVPFVLDAARKGFPKRGRGQTAANLFTRHNVGTLCTSQPDEEGGFTRTYNFREMALSAGPLDAPAVTATVSTEERTVTFMLEAMSPEMQSSLCNADDRVYGFVFDGVNLRGKLVELGTRGAGGEVPFTLPAAWSTEDLYAYAFARARHGRKASETVLLYPTD